MVETDPWFAVVTAVFNLSLPCVGKLIKSEEGVYEIPCIRLEVKMCGPRFKSFVDVAHEGIADDDPWFAEGTAVFSSLLLCISKPVESEKGGCEMPFIRFDVRTGGSRFRSFVEAGRDGIVEADPRFEA